MLIFLFCRFYGIWTLVFLIISWFCLFILYISNDIPFLISILFRQIYKKCAVDNITIVDESFVILVQDVHAYLSLIKVIK